MGASLVSPVASSTLVKTVHDGSSGGATIVIRSSSHTGMIAARAFSGRTSANANVSTVIRRWTACRDIHRKD